MLCIIFNNVWLLLCNKYQMWILNKILIHLFVEINIRLSKYEFKYERFEFCKMYDCLIKILLVSLSILKERMAISIPSRFKKVPTWNTDRRWKNKKAKMI